MKIKQKYEALGISLFLVMATAGCQNNTDSMEMQVARNEEWHVIHRERGDPDPIYGSRELQISRGRGSNPRPR